MKKEIKAIIFDVGGVIYIGEQNSNEYVYKKLQISKEKYFNLIGEILNKLITGKISDKAGLKEMAKKLEVSEVKLKQIWIEAIKKRFILNNPLIKNIKQLRKNYKIAILSDQWFIPHKILINREIKKIFDVMVFSHKIGFRKPNIEIYKSTLRKLNLNPEQCIFIDNQESHLIHARELGIKTILFKNSQQLKEDFEKFGVK